MDFDEVGIRLYQLGKKTTTKKKPENNNNNKKKTNKQKTKKKKKKKKKNTLQALHDPPPLCLVLLLRMFWHKNINVSTRFDQIHQLFHKILSINIILKSIKGHNSVEKFGKIMWVSHSMHLNKIWSKSIHFF